MKDLGNEPDTDASSIDLDAKRLAERIARQGAPGRRRAPSAPGVDSGSPAQAPRGDHDLNPDFYDPKRELTPAAVLVPIVEDAGELSILLTLRTDHLYDHAGQIAFPGGRIDDIDKTPEHCALRETEEEVGLPAERVRLVGRLDTYVTRTGFEVTPVVGLVRAPYPVEPDNFEVAEVFEVPLSHFLHPDSQKTDSRVYQGRTRYYYAFPYGRHYIWGATAGILVNLVEILSSGKRG
ncbi:MAG: CoA pyrophosphatase [Rhodovibrionaceae bacterium]|nr:CoA pyrophosphatase [Rhodovibrionaceae bacterium]